MEIAWPLSNLVLWVVVLLLAVDLADRDEPVLAEGGDKVKYFEGAPLRLAVKIDQQITARN